PLRFEAAVHPARDLLARRTQPADLPCRSNARRRRPAPRPAGHGGAAPMSGELVIDLKGLTKNFGPKRVVDHFDIQVTKGAIYGFLGPNGSGKTTTIRMLCGLLTADEGEGTCLGFDVRKEADRIKEQVG